MKKFKAGDFVVHVTGGPVWVVKHETVSGELYCERWTGAVMLRESFSEETLRSASSTEIASLRK
ncbi:hypothetical protein LJY25_08175 [Hymenobacter sp. BT175]|nr:hypothetical protein [Hymenobacter translucens]